VDDYHLNLGCAERWSREFVEALTPILQTCTPAVSGRPRRDACGECQACTEQYRWRRAFGGPKIEQVKRLKELELENDQRRKATSGLTSTS
jgi:hypothetical protein